MYFHFLFIKIIIKIGYIRRINILFKSLTKNTKMNTYIQTKKGLTYVYLCEHCHPRILKTRTEKYNLNHLCNLMCRLCQKLNLERGWDPDSSEEERFW